MGISKQGYIGGYIHIPPMTVQKTIQVKSCPNNHKKEEKNFCSVCGEKLIITYKPVNETVNSGLVLRSYLESYPGAEDQWRYSDSGLIYFTDRKRIEDPIDLDQWYTFARSAFLTSINLEQIINYIKTNFDGLNYTVGYGAYVVWE